MSPDEQAREVRGERRHREAAWSAYWGEPFPGPGGAVSGAEAQQWMDGDRVTLQDGCALCRIDKLARAFAARDADVEARARAAERADVMAWHAAQAAMLRSMAGVYPGGPAELDHQAAAHEHAVEAFMSGTHVGASKESGHG